jgi:hypothetical protein
MHIKKKIRNGTIYYSESNNKIVRVIRAHQEDEIAYIKHHEIEILNSEVLFSDLHPVDKETAKNYFTPNLVI